MRITTTFNQLCTLVVIFCLSQNPSLVVGAPGLTSLSRRRFASLSTRKKTKNRGETPVSKASTTTNPRFPWNGQAKLVHRGQSSNASSPHRTGIFGRSIEHLRRLKVPFGISFYNDDWSTKGALLLTTAATAAVVKNEVLHRAFYFWTRAGPMVVHYRFTQWWLRITDAPLDKRNVVYNNLHNRYCEPSLEIILHLKGLYVKIGQVLSSRPDVLPRKYIDLFGTVQDSIPPWPIERVERIVRDSLASDHGLMYNDVFEDMQETPLGSASIGQVHCATLKNRQQQKVAVKVMHPDAKGRFSHDFEVFKWLCRIALPGWKPILEELEKQIMTEFDYRNEAAALSQVRQNMMASPYRRRVHVPEPIHELCTKHVLVMELLEGTKLIDSTLTKLTKALGGDEQLARDLIERKKREFLLGQENGTEDINSPCERDNASTNSRLHNSVGLFRAIPVGFRLLVLQRQMRRYLDILLHVHGQQIFVDGMFNGDPHPGNILEMPNGKLGLIDYGQCKRLEAKDRLAMARIVALLGRHTNDNDEQREEKVAQAMRDFGFQTKNNRSDMLAKYATLFFDSDIEGKHMGFATPQLYLMHLTKLDPLVSVPDPAVFVARASFLFRGMGGMLEEQIRTARWWSRHAEIALTGQNGDE